VKVKAIVALEAHRNKKGFLGRLLVLSAVGALLLIPAAADAAASGGSAPAGKSTEVTIEKIPGKPAPRLILSAKAAERLGIEAGKVGEERIVRKQMVGGLILPPMVKRTVVETQPTMKLTSGVFGALGKQKSGPVLEPLPPGATSPEAGEVWVLVTLSPAEWERLAKDKPARLLPLATREKSGKEVSAKPSGLEPIEDMKRSMLSLYYIVSDKDHGLSVSNRVRVELEVEGNNEKQKVVPYSAIFYDAQGNAWVYVNTKPLTYERETVRVERIAGQLAVLSEGPSVGTPVVTIGASMLHGVEIFKK